MLLHFLDEYLGFDRIGNGGLYEIFSHDDILHEGDLEQVIDFIKNSSFQEVLLLLNPESSNAEFAQRILWMTWYALKLKGELMLQQAFPENEAAVKLLTYSNPEEYMKLETVKVLDEDEEDDDDDDEDYVEDINYDEDDDEDE